MLSCALLLALPVFLQCVGDLYAADEEGNLRQLPRQATSSSVLNSIFEENPHHGNVDAKKVAKRYDMDTSYAITLYPSSKKDLDRKNESRNLSKTTYNVEKVSSGNLSNESQQARIDEKLIDENYGAFLESVSNMLYSTDGDRLSNVTRDFLENIPAGKLESDVRIISPKKPAVISRETRFVLFDADQENIYEEDRIGLNIEIEKPEKTNIQYLQMAYEGMKMGQLEGATAIYKQILKRDPENTQALFGLAASYHKGRQLDRARDSYLRVLNIDGNHAPALNNMLLLAHEEAPKEALHLLHKLEQTNPEFPPLPAQIAMIYLNMGELEKSAKYMSRAVIISPENLDYRFNLAIVLDKMGNAVQASRIYKQLLAASMNGTKIPAGEKKIRERLEFIQQQQATG